MNQLHKVILCLGSNIRPEFNLNKAIDLLRRYGKIEALSSAWETHAVGSRAANYLNACLIFITSYSLDDLKTKVIRPIESRLIRVRDQDKNTPRTIDIDIVMFDGAPYKPDYWNKAFLLVPLNQILPGLEHPFANGNISGFATRVMEKTWMVERPEVITSR